jgi:protein-tyrosine phosphatase
MSGDRPIRVLFVCMGNICRSPMAEAVFRHEVVAARLSDRFEIDSAGTGAWHAGEPPHHGTRAVLARNGVDVGPQRARQVQPADFTDFDYILAMDYENLADLERFHPAARSRVRLFLDFAPQARVREVPDPYYTGGFDEVFQLVSAASSGLLAHIREREGM